MPPRPTGTKCRAKFVTWCSRCSTPSIPWAVDMFSRGRDNSEENESHPRREMMDSDFGAANEADILEECQRAIGYRFRQPELLRAALTHTSGANTRAASNERMEFLGDAILGMVCCEQLFTRYPD